MIDDGARQPAGDPSAAITIVSGLPRSGTSLMMQMLERGGLVPLSDGVRVPDENNPRGYFEFEPVKHLRSDRSWLAQARGRVVKIIHLLLRELPTDGSFAYRVVLMQRSVAEVLASQQAMLERAGKKSAPPETLAPIYAAQLSQVEAWITAHNVFSLLSVDHGRLLAHPHLEAERVNAFLGGSLDVGAMSSAVDPSLHRQRVTPQGK